MPGNLGIPGLRPAAMCSAAAATCRVASTYVQAGTGCAHDAEKIKQTAACRLPEIKGAAVGQVLLDVRMSGMPGAPTEYGPVFENMLEELGDGVGALALTCN